MIDLQANLMQKAFAAGRMDDARAHCKIFTELARERAKSFLNDGTEASGQHISCRAGTPSPYQEKDAQAGAREGGCCGVDEN
jgi:hypothetical protein